MRKRAIILLSGGLDSLTCLAIAKSHGFEPIALSFIYGQRHKIELQMAKQIAKNTKITEHKIIEIPHFGGSSLIDEDNLPINRSIDEISSQIPSTYVPARNLIFLSYGLALGELYNIYDIFIGVNAVDYSGYPDCRPEFIKSFTETANFATAYTVENNKKVKIHVPLINMSKAEIIKTGIELNVDYSQTLSCYNPDKNGKVCKICDSCKLRAEGFANIGIDDPAMVR